MHKSQPALNFCDTVHAPSVFLLTSCSLCLIYCCHAAGQRAELSKLTSIIQEADAERLRQRREYEAVLHERDVLGSQLIRRNDELALLYEKVKVQASTLNKGHMQYRDRYDGILNYDVGVVCARLIGNPLNWLTSRSSFLLLRGKPNLL